MTAQSRLGIGGSSWGWPADCALEGKVKNGLYLWGRNRALVRLVVQFHLPSLDMEA